MIRSLNALCGVDEDLNREHFLQELQVPSQGVFKCRIVYDDMTKEVEFIPYEPKSIRSLRVVEHDRINYEFKYKDRKSIDKLFALREDCDDILIVKKGNITDSSFANIVLKRDDEWYTPWSALLKGTMRQKLIDNGTIAEEEITVADLPSFRAFKLINAMLEFDGPEIDVSQIVL